MSASYSGSAGAVASGTNKTILTLISAAGVKPKLYEFNIGSVATPADQAAHFHLERFTAAGTEGSGFTPLPIDPAFGAAAADYGVGVFGAEPTYTASAVLFSISLNQRASYRWVAAPGKELRAPATASNGIGLQVQTSNSTQAYEASMLHEE